MFVFDFKNGLDDNINEIKSIKLIGLLFTISTSVLVEDINIF